MGIPGHFSCLLRDPHAAGQEATVKTIYGATDWFKFEKGVCQGYVLSHAYLICLQNALCDMLGWMKHKLESKLPTAISIILDMQRTPPL